MSPNPSPASLRSFYFVSLEMAEQGHSLHAVSRSVGRHLSMSYSSAMNAGDDLSQWQSGRVRKAALEVK